MEKPVDTDTVDVEIPSTDKPPAQPTSPGSKGGLWFGLIVLVIPLIVYIYTLCPTLSVGDDGDFITAAFTLGVPHPPGYPLYTLLGWLFINLPIPGGISAPAFRMNFMSAMAAWGACIFMFLFLRRVLKTEWAALAGALVLAFSRQFWIHAVITEVYTLQILFLTLILYLGVLYVQEKKVGWALLLAFVMGLAVTHQYAILLFYPGVLIFIGVNGGLRLRWYTWLLAIFLAIVGFAPYAYLPLVHYKTPLGEVVFVDSEAEAAQVSMDKVPVIDSPFSYFWDYFTRRHYSKSRVYTHSREAMPERTTTSMVLNRTIKTAEEDFSVPLLIFGFLGWLAVLISLRRQSWKYGGADPVIPRAALLPLVLGYILYFLVVHFYPSGDILAAPIENLEVVVAPLLIPLEAALAGIIAVGFDAARRWIAAYIQSQGVRDIHSSQKYRTFAGLLAIAIFSLIAVNAWRNAEYGDKSQHVLAYNYALNVLDSCDPDAILLTTGDETFLYWYCQYCEPSDDPDDPRPGYRKDVWATNWIQNLPTLTLLADEANAMRVIAERFVVSSTYYSPYLQNFGILLMEPDYGPRPLNSTFVTDTFADSELLMGLDCVLQGLTYTFRRPGDVPDISEPGVERSMDFAAVERGGKALEVIDYFDARPFDEYRYEGLPGFEGVAEDFSNLDTAPYISMRLEAQEQEVLGRYQDSLYRFGIQSLLQDDPDSYERAVRYLFDTVSMNPADWFGWKELGDAFFATGRLDSSRGAYEQLLMLAAAKGDVPVNQESAAYAQIAHITLIQGYLEEARSNVNLALALNPDNDLALAVLEELDRQESEQASDSASEEPDEIIEEPLDGDEGTGALEEFDIDPSGE